MSNAKSTRSGRERGRKWILAAGLLGGALFWPGAGIGEPAGPFAPFLGSWKGSGQVTVNDGHKERIACRATYTASESGQALTQSLVCAGDSYRFQVQSYVEATGRNLLGHWEEESRNVAGQFSGQLTGGLFVGNIVGPTFTAQMSLNATDRQQVVDIKPQGASFSSVDIVLSRQR